MRDNRHSGLKIFYICLAAYAVIMFAGIIAALNMLSDRLSEAGRNTPGEPSGAAEAVFDEFFSGSLDRAALEYCPELSEFESTEIFLSALENIRAGRELALSGGTKSADGRYEYEVKAGEDTFAHFFLSQMEDGGWLLESVEFEIRPDTGVTVTVYRGSTAFVNGVPLTEKFETGRDMSHWSNSAMPEDGDGNPAAEGLYTVTYRVEGLYGDPEVTAEGENGEPAAVTQTGEDTYVQELEYHLDRLDEVGGRILSAAKAYCGYMYRDAELLDTALYIDSDGELYAALKEAADFWSVESAGAEFSEESVEELYFYGDNVFSCRVLMKAACADGTAADIDLTAVFYREETAWMLYSVTGGPGS